MNKRKIEINQLKKNSLKGKKYRTINVNYETVLAYFKQKEVKEKDIFKCNFFPLISDLLNQFNSLDTAYRLLHGIKEPAKLIDTSNPYNRLDSFIFKRISSQFPISDLADCLYLEKDSNNQTISVGISKNKLMLFFKNLRLIYSQFCFCVGQKYILENIQFKNLYQAFQIEWNKYQQKAKNSPIQKLEKRVCRSLYFFGVLIQNNIFSAIEERERKKIQEQSEFGTKSQKKLIIKSQNNPVSSTYSIGSADLLSNISIVAVKSQKSNEEDCFNMKNQYSQKPMKNQYSQKSQKILWRPRFNFFSKAQIKNLKIKIFPYFKQSEINNQCNNQHYEINLLSNEVENILIQQAFKLQKWKDGCERPYYNQNPYMYFNYMPTYNYQCFQVNPQTNNLHQLQQIKRSYDFYNLVQIRKNQNNKLGNKNYN